MEPYGPIIVVMDTTDPTHPREIGRLRLAVVGDAVLLAGAAEGLLSLRVLRGPAATDTPTVDFRPTAMPSPGPSPWRPVARCYLPHANRSR